MKKLLLVLFVMGISLQSFAGLKEKHVIGSWKYKVEMGQATLTGILKFEKKEGNLSGEVITDNGETIPLKKVEIRENNVLYFEVEVDYDVINISVTVEGNKFKGMIGNVAGEVAITGDKIE